MSKEKNGLCEELLSALADWPKTSNKYWVVEKENYRMYVAVCLKYNNCYLVDKWEWTVKKSYFKPDKVKRQCRHELALFESTMLNGIQLSELITGLTELSPQRWELERKAFIYTVFMLTETGKMSVDRKFYSPLDFLKF
jgi:hypothetical protein